jgi:predicted metal-dependent enzyme (double-stranded beta helix superfamily)
MLIDALHMLNGVARLEPALALREVGPVLGSLARRGSVEVAIERLLRSAPDGPVQTPERDPLWQTLAEVDGCVLQAFLWPAGARTAIHDHTSWGVYACVLGQLGEDRYARLDDGANEGRAQLRQDWQRVWSAQEQSTLLPYAGGIHRVRNAGLTPAVSLHLYGPRQGEMDGRDYDARRDRVCDRAPDVELRQAA